MQQLIITPGQQAMASAYLCFTWFRSCVLTIIQLLTGALPVALLWLETVCYCFHRDKVWEPGIMCFCHVSTNACPVRYDFVLQIKQTSSADKEVIKGWLYTQSCCCFHVSHSQAQNIQFKTQACTGSVVQFPFQSPHHFILVYVNALVFHDCVF